MKVQIKKGRGGPDTLACVRNDGSRTWSRVHPFFPEHDLTHYAVESVLAFDQAFFGLIAAGWNIDDFARPGTSKRIPAQAVLAEHIVGLFDLERGQGARLASEDFRTMLAEKARESMPELTFAITDEQLDRVRALRSELVSRWWSIAEGDTLELQFPAPDVRVVGRRVSTHDTT